MQVLASFAIVTSIAVVIDYSVSGGSERTAEELSEEDKEFPHQVRNTFIAGVFGLTVIVTYALLRGVVSIHLNEEDGLD